MSGQRPSSKRSVLIVLAAMLCFWIGRNPGQTPKLTSSFPADPLCWERPAFWTEYLRQAAPGVQALPDGRDAPASLPSPPPAGGLKPLPTDWNIWNDKFFEVTVSRRDRQGKITESRQTLRFPARAVPSKAGSKREKPEASSAEGEGWADPSTAAAERRRARGRTPRAYRGPIDFTALAQRAEMGEEEGEEDPEWARSAADSEESFGGKVQALFRKFQGRYGQRQRRMRLPRLTLKALLGKGLLRPPPGRPIPPDFTKLPALPSPPNGGAVNAEPMNPHEIERLDTPDADPHYKAWRQHAGYKKPHWHQGVGGHYFHQGGSWGNLESGRWAWEPRSSGYFWTLGGRTPLLKHKGHWWWRTQDGWFLLHSGQAWAYRQFDDLRRDGLIHPQTRVRIIYSADARRVAIVIPGRETIVYDLETGTELGRIPHEDR